MKYLTTVVLLCISFFSVANSSLPTNRHVAVTGTAKVSVAPDIVVLSIEAESLKSTSIEAKRELDKRVNLFLSGLSQFNIDESNISASEISVGESKSYVGGKERLNGYKASRKLKLTFKDIDQLSPLLDFALELNIDEVRSINLRSSDAIKHQNHVNSLALKNAKEKAVLFSKALDASVSSVYSINSNRSEQRYTYGSNTLVEDIEVIEVRGMRGSRTRDLPGKYLKANIIFSSSVNVVFDIEVK